MRFALLLSGFAWALWTYCSDVALNSNKLSIDEDQIGVYVVDSESGGPVSGATVVLSLLQSDGQGQSVSAVSDSLGFADLRALKRVCGIVVSPPGIRCTIGHSEKGISDRYIGVPIPGRPATVVVSNSKVNLRLINSDKTTWVPDNVEVAGTRLGDLPTALQGSACANGRMADGESTMLLIAPDALLTLRVRDGSDEYIFWVGPYERNTELIETTKPHIETVSVALRADPGLRSTGVNLTALSRHTGSVKLRSTSEFVDGVANVRRMVGHAVHSQVIVRLGEVDTAVAAEYEIDADRRHSVRISKAEEFRMMPASEVGDSIVSGSLTELQSILREPNTKFYVVSQVVAFENRGESILEAVHQS